MEEATTPLPEEPTEPGSEQYPEPEEYPTPAPEPERPRIASFSNRIYAQGGRYIYIGEKRHIELTNFLIHPVALVECENQKLYVADYVTVDGNCCRIGMTPTELSSCSTFHNKLNEYGIERQFYGDSKSMEALKGYLDRLSWPKKKEVTATGLYPTEHGYVYVGEEGAIAADGSPVDDILLMNPDGNGLHSDILQAKTLQAEQLQAMGPSLLAYNELPKTVSILGWIAGCFVKQHLLNGRSLKFPHLGLSGEAGSGKSSTLEGIIHPIFSCRDQIYDCSNISAFALMKLSSTSNLFPLTQDEHKPWTQGKQKTDGLNNHLRNSYDNHKASRGNPDKSTTDFALLAPQILAGEAAPSETAVKERMIQIVFSKLHLQEPEDGTLPEGLPSRKDAFRYLRNHEDELASFGKALLFAALSTTEEEALGWYDEGHPYFSEELPPRIRNNLSCCYAGLKLVGAACERLGLRWEDVFPISTEDCLPYLESAAVDYLLGGTTHNASIVEKTLEILSRTPLVPYTHYWFDSTGEKLMLSLPTCYDLLGKYAREHGLQEEIMGQSEFRSQLRFSRYIIKGKKGEPDSTRNLDYQDPDQKTDTYRKSVRVTILDYKKLMEDCDVSGFRAKWYTLP